jgi:hypothetical protein
MITFSKRCLDALRSISNGLRNTLSNDKLDKGQAIEAVTKTAVDMMKYPAIRQQFATVVRNNYLSATSTFIKNFLGNMTRLIETPLARAASGRFSEAGDMLVGYYKGFQKFFPRFIEGFNNPYIEFDGQINKAYGVYLKAPGQDPGKVLQTVNRGLNAVVTFPQNVQRGVDEAFNSMFERAQYEVILNRAKNNVPEEYFTRIGMSREDYINKLDELVTSGAVDDPLWKTFKNFDPSIASEIEEFARFGTFRSRLGDSLIDTGTKKMVELVNKVPELSLVLPFIVTPTNIAKFGAGYVPGLGMLRYRQGAKDIQDLTGRLGVLQEKFNKATGDKAKENLRNKIGELQGQLKFKQDLNRDFIGQQVLGVGLIATAYSMVEGGMLTGNYPSDPAKRTAMMQSKVPPLSIKVGDRWIGYNGLEPVHTVLALVTDTMTMLRDARLNGMDTKDLVTGTAEVIKNAFLDKTFTEPLSRMLLAVQEPNRAESMLVSLTNGLTPNILNQLGKIQDPVMREVRDPDLAAWIMNNLYSRIPGMREELPIRPDALGQPQSLGSTAELVSGFTNRKAEQTLRQSFFNNPQLGIRPPSRDVYGVELTAEQYERMATSMGQYTSIVVDLLASNPGFQRLPDSLKAKLYTNIVTNIRSDVRMRMIPELAASPEQRLAMIISEYRKRGINPYEVGGILD